MRSKPAFLPIMLVMLSAATALSQVTIGRKPRFKAVAFDYFVIFDPSSITPAVEREFPGKGVEIARTWQRKQFEYAFLRSITGDFKDFYEVTADALDFTVRSMGVPVAPQQRERLLNSYLALSPWPDAADGLRKLRAAGVRIITIANFSPRMLRSNAENAGITELFDSLLSTGTNRSFKPDRKAYMLGLKKLHLERNEVLFAAFGGWDVYGAKRFGYQTYWVNRFGQPLEVLGVVPDATSGGMDGLVKFVLGKE